MDIQAFICKIMKKEPPSKIKVILAYLLWITGFGLHAQNKSVVEAYFNSGNYSLAYKELLKFSDFGNDGDLHYYLGVCYLESDLGRDKAIKPLQRAVQCPNPKPLFFYELGRAYHLMGLYEQAVIALNEFRELAEQTSEKYRAAAKIINACTTALRMEKEPQRFKVKSFSPYINTLYDEQAFLIYPKGDFIIFSSNRAYNSHADLITNDVFINSKNQRTNLYKASSKTKNTDTTSGFRLPSRVKIADFQGVPLSVSADLKTFLLLGRTGNQIIDELYTVEWNGRNWKNLTRLPSAINNGTKFFGATFADAGRTIIFSSQRAHSKGGFDLYISKLAKGVWSQPVNLGDSINSEADEVTPFLAADNQTLYFSSNREGSIGGFDIYASRITHNEKWLYPVNQGLPINSPSDDLYFSTKTDLGNAYFSSNRVSAESVGGFDIYFAANQQIETRIAVVTGKISARRGNNPVSVKISIIPEDTTYRFRPYLYGSKADSQYVAFVGQGRHYQFKIQVDSVHEFAFRISVSQDAKIYTLSQAIEIKQVTLLGKTIGEILVLSNPIHNQSDMDRIGQNEAARNSRLEGYIAMLKAILENNDSTGFRMLDEFNNSLKMNTEQRDQYLLKIIAELDSALNKGFEEVDKVGRIQGRITGNQGVWVLQDSSMVVAKLSDPFVKGTSDFSETAQSQLQEIFQFLDRYKGFKIRILKNKTDSKFKTIIEQKVSKIRQVADRSLLDLRQNRLEIEERGISPPTDPKVIIEVVKINR